MTGETRAFWRVVGVMCALALLMLPPAAAADSPPKWERIADWRLDENPGATTMRDQEIPRHNGEIDHKVKLNGKAYRFTGKKHSRVIVKQNQADLNPKMKTWRLRMRLKPAKLSDLPQGTSLNIIQKGRIQNSGGHWKIEYLTSSPNQGRVRCSMHDEMGRETALVSKRIDDGKFHNVTCTINRGPEPRLILKVDKDVREEALPRNFGSVKPHQPDKDDFRDNFGKQVTIGRKPTKDFDPDDAFSGTVSWIVVEVRKK